ncbi:MAG TPA: MATE family efflux transporter [Burkholderiales bacterium]|nr:MATE family efflux transporter [Burkholderiales bacterium]
MNATARDKVVEGPIAKSLLSLSWPVLVVLALQTLVGLAETYFVSFLGTDALAGVALVFPLFMLMTMMSNGGIGGGVSSAVARALGAGRMKDAEALAMHAVVVGLVFGALFAIGAWLGGPALFRRMGAEGETLATAILYSNVVFLAAIPGWVANLLAAALRGTGNVRVPAIVTAAGSLITLLLSPLFIFGWGWVPPMGVAGAGAALVCFNLGSATVLALYMRSGSTRIRVTRTRLQWRLLNDILRVGLLSAVGTVVANLTVVITTALIGGHGREAIAGYGLASRLDYLLIPLLFALGTASVTMVGTSIGAGQPVRARKIAWTGALLSTLPTAAIGCAAALFPGAWIHLFSHDPGVVEAGSAYLARVAPFYALFGAGMSLYFSSQGAGRMLWPFSAGMLRLCVVAIGGSYWLNGLHGSLNGLYWIVAAGYLVFGAVNLLALASGLSWARLTPIGGGIRHAGR